MKKLILLLVAAISCNGCGTLAYRTSRRTAHSPQGVYPGVKTDITMIKYIASEGGGATSLMAYPMYLLVGIDIPISGALDTLCLPYDIWRNSSSD